MKMLKSKNTHTHISKCEYIHMCIFIYKFYTKEMVVAILISDKRNFKGKGNTGYLYENFMMIKASIYQDNITILNQHAPMNITLQFIFGLSFSNFKPQNK